MSVYRYLDGDKMFYRVYVNGHDARGNRFQRKKIKVETMREVQKIDFEFRRELALKMQEEVPYRFHEWFDHCMKHMKLEYKPSTIYNYETQIKKWVMDHWMNTDINKITKFDVHEMIYEHCAAVKTPNNLKTILKMLKRLFQMAVEEGEIDTNPCKGSESKRLNQR